MRQFVLSDFDFHLPEALIAQQPLSSRTDSRLLDGTQENPNDRIFKELPDLLQANDLLIMNDTEVVKARLFGNKPSGGRLELLVERVLENNHVVGHLRVSKKPAIGSVMNMDGGYFAEFLGRESLETGGLFRFKLFDQQQSNPYALMAAHGHIPLPPYIERSDNEADLQRYQTVFAKNPGAVAAPTAALHFDEALLETIKAKGVKTATVTLHVGAGTFMPVKSESIAQHTMHAERYWVPLETQQAITDCKAKGGRVVAVGTTTVRTLESWAQSGQDSGDTQIFITPGFDFKIVDVLITNFHLPKSTLLMLVSAFTGYEKMMALYRHAISQQYRFFSYGDAMILKRQPLE